MSENGKPNIYQRIIAVMKGVRYVQKEDRKVNNLYTFVSHDAVVAAIRPHLEENRIAVIPTVLGTKQDGNRTVMKVRITLVNSDNPEETVSVDMVGYGIDPQDKGPGKAFSYAYKYAFLKLFCLETGDDPERDNIDYKANGGTKKTTASSKPDTDTSKPQVVPPTPESEEHKQAFDELTKLCAEKFFEAKKAMADAGLKQYLSLENLRQDILVKLIQKKTPELTLKKVNYIRDNWAKALNQLVESSK